MGLIGNGLYYLPRQSYLGGASVVAHCITSRPIWKAMQHRQLFDKDYLSFPSGTYQSAICLPMKYGGMGMRLASSGSAQADIQAWASGAATIGGIGEVISAALTGLKNSPCTMTGSGAMTAAVKGTGTISCTVSIGAQPSAFDIAQAVWGMDNGIETGWTPRQIMRIMAAALAGKVSGSDANAPAFRSVTDSKARITATTDADGNRLSVSLDGD